MRRGSSWGLVPLVAPLLLALPTGGGRTTGPRAAEAKSGKPSRPPGKPPPAAPALPVVAGELGRRIDAALAEALPPTTWGLVLVAREGELVFARGYGAADYASRPIDLSTHFELASASKQVTATAILRLEQQGRLRRSDPLAKLLRGVPADKARVTVQHLLNHTAGLDPGLGVPYASTIGRPAYLRAMLEPPLAAEPGAAFSYSNVGYALLAAVVEEVSGKAFEDYVQRELFAPAGLTDSGFVNDGRLEALGRAAVRRGEEPGSWTAARWHYGWGYRGMGGVVTTGLDLLAWDRALRGDAVLGAAARQQLHAPALEGYAAGWKVETTDRGTLRAHHSGGVMGFRCQLSRWPDEDAFLAVLTNGEGDPFLAERVILPLLFPPARLEATLEAGPLPLDGNGAVIARADVRVTLSRERGGFGLEVAVGRHALARLALTGGHLARLAEGLAQALAGRPEGDGPADVEAGLYLGPYGRVARQQLTEQLSLDVRSRYEGVGADGRAVVDERTLIVLVDGRRGAWPLMLKLDAGTARSLLARARDLLPAAPAAPR